ncbi:hypothetical protein [Brevibacillus sp. H7]|uniref:hypothetical protein n=1 Tax=Brevibacillus sp. H7 TaxID=3349138 RepID=UPI0038191774
MLYRFRLVMVVAMVLVIVGGFSTVSSAAIEEYDAVLRDWKRGQELDLQHPLFSLNYVSAGRETSEAILFKGRAKGEAGRVTLKFYSLAGDLLHAPPGSLVQPSVKPERPDFIAGGIVPPQQRGKSGLVQVTFQGQSGKRAAFYLKVYY